MAITVTKHQPSSLVIHRLGVHSNLIQKKGRIEAVLSPSPFFVCLFVFTPKHNYKGKFEKKKSVSTTFFGGGESKRPWSGFVPYLNRIELMASLRNGILPALRTCRLEPQLYTCRQKEVRHHSGPWGPLQLFLAPRLKTLEYINN